MGMLAFLIVFPLCIAVLLTLIRADKARNVLVCVSAAVIACASIALVAPNIGSGYCDFKLQSEYIDYISTLVSCVCVIVILAFSYKYKNIWAAILAVVQIVIVFIVEFGYASDVEVEMGLYYDGFSLLMTLIIGIIGSAICVYALGYMQDFQKHEPEGAKDRRPTFFALMFVFLSAMFVIVFSNNMSWMFAGWEVTTLCSFLLIGYTKTEEAINNAFRQIIMNLAGGIGFILALLFAITDIGTLSLVDFIEAACLQPEIAVVPVLFLAFAGITKAAQMPFQTWLLGAMVAPTPTSALLHSSTMVKAGVFLLVKLAPCFLVSTIPSVVVILVGGITFMLCSFMAISQSNGKRVLAYSTIANLGLITACAGVGTPEAVWAAMLLILFHAIAKSLLFLCVGTAEHHIGSRDIEDMDLMFDKMPRLARFMMLGIMCMFIAPFGMLVAKWGALVSFVQMNQIALVIILAFGSAATFMFWSKWLGKLAGVAGQQENIEGSVHATEWVSLLVMAILLVVGCVLLPVVSQTLINPYIEYVFGYTGQDVSSANLWLGSICVIVVVIALFAGLNTKGKARKVDVYLSGVSVNSDDRTFVNSMSGKTQATTRNWYMSEYFGEDKIAPIGVVFNSAIMLAAIVLGLLGVTFL
jgi:ech hydrogenase subunit A